MSPARDIVPLWEVKHHVQDTDFLTKKKNEETSPFPGTACKVVLCHQNRVIYPALRVNILT